MISLRTGSSNLRATNSFPISKPHFVTPGRIPHQQNSQPRFSKYRIDALTIRDARSISFFDTDIEMLSSPRDTNPRSFTFVRPARARHDLNGCSRDAYLLPLNAHYRPFPGRTSQFLAIYFKLEAQAEFAAQPTIPDRIEVYKRPGAIFATAAFSTSSRCMTSGLAKARSR